MSTTQAIPNTRLSGTQTFNFNALPAGTQWVELDIDRTVSGGLNSLPYTENALIITVDRSTDGGVTWQGVAGIDCVGGTLTVKGVTQTTEELTIGVDPSDTNYRVNTTASTPVRIAGQVVYLP